MEGDNSAAGGVLVGDKKAVTSKEGASDKRISYGGGGI